MNYLSHDIFLRSLKIKGEIITKSRIHIGSTRDIVAFERADSLLSKIFFQGQDLPYIPGSSLKGIFRTVSENILESIGFNVCELNDRESSCFKTGQDILVYAQAGDNKKILEELNNFCFACKIFGGTNYNSHIIFSDANPLNINSVATGIAPGIAINRMDGTAIQGGLFHYEYILPGSKFSFQIIIKNLPNFLIGLIFKVLHLINKNIVLIGGKKRAGLGEISILINELDFISNNESENFKINFENFRNFDFIVIPALNCENINDDLAVKISLTKLKDKGELEFSENIIENFMEVWDNYVKNKSI
ncbi:MAG: type III CRISPR-associated RAMP protein Csx7 [Candidatus Helarchaeota archaeon]